MAIYMVKVTFTLAEDTVATLRRSAARLKKPQSAIVREAIAEHAERIGRLTDVERAQMLRTLEAYMAQPAARSDADTDAELRELRQARRAAGLHRSRRRR